MLNALQAMLLDLPHKLLGLSLMLLAAGAVFVLAERKWPLHPAPVLRRQWLQDLGYYFMGVLPAFVMLPFIQLTLLLLQPLGPMPWHAWVAALPGPVHFVAWVVLSEAAYYWAHRLAHEVPWFWRFHAIHHSAPHVDWLVDTRAHPLDIAFLRSFIFVCLYVLGWGNGGGVPRDLAPAIYTFWMTAWSFFVHANIRLRLGWLEYVVSTPAFHHWHHVKGDPALVDKNYAAVLPCMDMLFGSYYLPRTAWPKQYGIDDELAPTLWGQLIGPLRGRRVRQIGLKAWGRESLPKPVSSSRRSGPTRNAPPAGFE